MRERSKRQSFLGPNSDDVITRAHVAVVGLGGGGSHVAQQLAHVGVGHLTLIDFDIAEDTNLNRLVGATQRDVDDARPKAEILERVVHGVLPDARVTALRSRWQDVADHLREADAIVGCVDSFSERFQLEGTARRFLTPYIDIGMDVTEGDRGYIISGQAALSLPGYLCLKCMGVIREEDLAREQYGVAGGKPQVVWPNGILASVAVGYVVQLLTPWSASIGAQLVYLDGQRHELRPHSWVEENRLRGCTHYPIDANATGDPFFSHEPPGRGER